MSDREYMSRLLIILLFLSTSATGFAKTEVDIEKCGNDPSCKRIGTTKAPTDLDSVPATVVESFAPFASGDDKNRNEKKIRTSQTEQIETPHSPPKAREQENGTGSASDESAG